MTFRSFVLFACFQGLLVLLGSRDASACTCISPNPVCSAYWKTDAVFVGEVVSVVALGDRPANMLPRKRVHLRVVEAFSGTTTSEVDVETGAGNGDCGYPFQIGGVYLVFGSRSTRAAAFTTDICSPTRPFRESDTDIAYLRGLKGPAPASARIYGTAMSWDPSPNRGSTGPGPRVPFVGARAIAKGATGTFSAVSGSDGTFDIPVPPGRYAMSVEVPEGKYSLISPREIALDDTRACAEVPITVHADGRLSGAVRDVMGAAISGLGIEFLPADRLNDQYLGTDFKVRTSEAGTFVVAQLPPGRYAAVASSSRATRIVLTIDGPNGPAREFLLGAGERLALGTLRIPSDVALGRVSGLVVDETGAPVNGARVYFRVPGSYRTVGTPVESGADGRFDAVVVRGTLYDLVAEIGVTLDARPRFRTSNTVTAVLPDGDPVVLIIRREPGAQPN
jgi:hypothetical protein